MTTIAGSMLDAPLTALAGIAIQPELFGLAELEHAAATPAEDLPRVGDDCSEQQSRSRPSHAPRSG